MQVFFQYTFERKQNKNCTVTFKDQIKIIETEAFKDGRLRVFSCACCVRCVEWKPHFTTEYVLAVVIDIIDNCNLFDVRLAEFWSCGETEETDISRNRQIE